jgi:uncharacterized protein YndB with AHSA1/START domain
MTTQTGTGSAHSATADREIVTTRLIVAPRELVWRAFTQQEHIHHWWGPNGFTTTTSEMDVRSGGVWRFVMHGPDGRDYVNKIVYRDVQPPALLTYMHSGDEGEPVQFHTTVTFDEVEGGTQLTMKAVFPSAAERERVVREYGAVEGAKQTVARLAEYVKTME